jgi:hypothetical protein
LDNVSEDGVRAQQARRKEADQICVLPHGVPPARPGLKVNAAVGSVVTAAIGGTAAVGSRVGNLGVEIGE